MSVIDRLHKLKMIIFDVDGVFTDGKTWQDARGMLRRQFSVRDTMGIRALRKAGLQVVVLTNAQTAEIRHHMTFVGVDELHENCANKRVAISEIATKMGLQWDEIALMTSDTADVELIKELGCGITVPTASESLREVSLLATSHSGGDGAVLEACGMILKSIRSRASEQKRAVQRAKKSASF